VLHLFTESRSERVGNALSLFHCIRSTVSVSGFPSPNTASSASRSHRLAFCLTAAVSLGELAAEKENPLVIAVES
jgi:hypothetical protein